jgi:hypothetical protein
MLRNFVAFTRQVPNNIYLSLLLSKEKTIGRSM